MELYVNEIKVGEYDVFCSQWDIEISQKKEAETGWTYQTVYFVRDFADFFTIYEYQDYETGDIDNYLIDTREIPEDSKEYHAIKMKNTTSTSVYTASLILQNYL